MLYKMVLAFTYVFVPKPNLRLVKQNVVKTSESVDDDSQMKAIEQFYHVVLFITLYKVVLTFKSLDETLVCDHSNESY